MRTFSGLGQPGLWISLIIQLYAIFVVAKREHQKRAFGSELCGHDSCDHEPALPAFSTDAPPKNASVLSRA